MRLFITLLLSTLASASFAANNSLSQSTYEELNSIQEQLAAQQYSEAEEALLELEDDLIPGFGLALTYQLHGQLYLLQEKNTEAMTWYSKALSLNALAPAQESALSTTLAQLHLAAENTSAAIAELEPRLTKILQLEKDKNSSKRKGDKEKNADWIQPLSFITLASAYQLEKNYAASIPWLLQGIERTQSRGDKPKENWLQMLMAAHYQQKSYLKTAAVLDDLLRINPAKEDYWQQQAAIYQLLEKPKLALRTLELGYAGHYLKKADSILLLVQLLISENIPERAGRILQAHIKDETVELNERNWRLLAAAWQQGRERDKAVIAMREASAFMDDGSLLYRAAQMQQQAAQYQEALNDSEAALKKGLSERDKPRALMLAGSCAYELKDFAKARRYFQQALTLAAVAANARVWLDYLDTLEQYPG
ncbi:tetratricopeptide repeat protein [Thalassolituus hydrocarboniclasticus]|uniref:Tetratricopeptide repeat protein n=1 Tax=Thalassolituus hydrocarboniclasticus TaxID=2742796 RepID=A0ABY6AB29_9GAMM|nr:tetratricopeptide repeat protein [Thalassolituus hydrocarboniclasticus]UXD87491.1 hypothetical protein HUF19_08605 [Thalassolituus hydrocarboniclasticus]